jgi:hypothetical protein
MLFVSGFGSSARQSVNPLLDSADLGGRADIVIISTAQNCLF